MLAQSSADGSSLDNESLKIFYSEIFPYDCFAKWLYYNDESRKSFRNREFSFTFANGSYLRFQAFDDIEAFRQFLIKNCPFKIDLGAVYNTKPNERKTVNSNAFKPVERELVFDLDMTDYDNVRTCCQGKCVCTKCWKFLACAMRVIDTSLREDFGFQKLFWVFSGRRGLHCWVSDESARELNVAARKSIVSFFEDYLKSSDFFPNVRGTRFSHPFFQRSLKIMRYFFETYVLIQQDFLITEKAENSILDKIAISEVTNSLRKLWKEEKSSDPVVKWHQLNQVLEDLVPKKKNEIINGIVCFYMLPRIDSHVSIQLNHLLKVPFCIHPDSGKICIPVTEREIEVFDPASVPTIYDLISNKLMGIELVRKFSKGVEALFDLE